MKLPALQEKIIKVLIKEGMVKDKNQIIELAVFEWLFKNDLFPKLKSEVIQE